MLAPLIAIGSDWSELAQAATFEAVHLNQPEIKELPDYSPPERTGQFGMSIQTSFRHTNSDFYRERAEYVRFGAKLRPMRLGIRNEGTALASGIKLVTQIADPDHLIEFAVGSKRPKKPQRHWSPIDNIGPVSMNQVAPDIEVIETSAGWTITAYFGKVQAKDTRVTDEQLFVGMIRSGMTDLPVSVFADELSSPVSSVLSLKFVVSEKELTFEQLTS